MREIKFRGLSKKTKEWVYGYYVKANMDTHWIVQMNYLGQLLPFDTHEVIPETVGQYRDLKDKNGVEIFEGDICKITYDISSPNADKAQYCKATAIILYDDERLCWFWSFWDQNKTVIDVDEYEVTTIVIIGNVIENKELLEQK